MWVQRVPLLLRRDSAAQPAKAMVVAAAQWLAMTTLAAPRNVSRNDKMCLRNFPAR
jgi:hypothetical protein